MDSTSLSTDQLRIYEEYAIEKEFAFIPFTGYFEAAFHARLQRCSDDVVCRTMLAANVKPFTTMGGVRTYHLADVARVFQEQVKPQPKTKRRKRE